MAGPWNSDLEFNRELVGFPWIRTPSSICLLRAVLNLPTTLIWNSTESFSSLWSVSTCLSNTLCLLFCCNALRCSFPLMYAFLHVSPSYDFSICLSLQVLQMILYPMLADLQLVGPLAFLQMKQFSSRSQFCWNWSFFFAGSIVLHLIRTQIWFFSGHLLCEHVLFSSVFFN